MLRVLTYHSNPLSNPVNPELVRIETYAYSATKIMFSRLNRKFFFMFFVL